MRFDPGRIFYEMCYIFDQHYNPDNKVVICNEGSSRSSKTFDAFHFIYTFCDHNRDEGHDIYILRDTLKNCRKHTFRDFKKFMKIVGHNPKYLSENQSPEVELFGNNIYFLGLDDSNVEGYPSSIVFFNESLEMDQGRIEGISMRCEMMEIYDWNPKYTQHWCFDMEGNPNTFFTHSTYKDNRHLKVAVRNKIESYCPWHFEDFHLKEKDRRPHPENVKNGTANEYRWKVYGEGVRAAPDGLIFEYANYIDKWPEDVAHVYGLDYGFTNDPSALVRVGETPTDIYLELLLYEPTATPAIIDGAMSALKIERHLPITADSSDKFTAQNKGTIEMNKDLKTLGWQVKAVRKNKSVIHWLNKMQDKRINIINNHLVQHAKRCQQNYSYKVVNGIKLNQPDGEKRVTVNGKSYKFNDFWDGARYGFMSFYQNEGGMW